MAVRTVRVDDMDEEQEATETLSFAFEQSYREIDLSDDNAKRFREAIAPFMRASRPLDAKVGARRFADSPNGQTFFDYGTYDPAEVRKWATANNVDCNDRGRVPADVVQLWREAQEVPEEPKAEEAPAAAPAKKK